MNKEQIKEDIANVDKQMEGAAKSFGTTKLIVYLVGVLAIVGIISLLVKW